MPSPAPSVSSTLSFMLSAILPTGSSKPHISSFQPKTANQISSDPKSTCPARHRRLQVCSLGQVFGLPQRKKTAKCFPVLICSVKLEDKIRRKRYVVAFVFTRLLSADLKTYMKQFSRSPNLLVTIQETRGTINCKIPIVSLGYRYFFWGFVGSFSWREGRFSVKNRTRNKNKIWNSHRGTPLIGFFY